MPSLIRSSRGYGKNNSSQVTDVNAKDTSLLLTGDQTSKSWIADNSLLNADPTIVGDTKPSNLNPYTEGFYSNYFDGNGDYLVVPSNYKTGFLIGDFTIEMWVYPTVITGSHLLVNYGTETTSRIQFFINSSFQLAYDLYGTGTSTFTSGPKSGALLLNTWSHIAFVRSGSTVTAYLNGISQGTSALGTGTVGNGAGPLYIGVNSALNAGHYYGYISNLRVLRSLALYTSNFIPPTEPLTRTPETVLLTCQSNRFIDRSINIYQLAATGGVRISPFVPFEKNLRVPQYVNSGSNSVYFDGTVDCLGAESSNGILPADFTVEMWVYLTSSIANKPLVAFGTEVSGRFSLLTNASGQLKYAIYGDATEYIYTTIAMILNTWTHVAFSRTGTSIYAFINGDSAGAVKTLSGSMGVGTRISVGASAARDSSMTGYLSSVRIVNGTGLYTTAFTPSITPLTAIANTSLLVCQSSTIVDNGPNAYAITVSGDAAVSDFYLDTPVYKSLTGDNGSISFDGTGDYITIPYDTRYNIPASTPFTFEAWAYTTATTEFHLLNRNWAYGYSGPTYAFFLASGTTPTWQIAGTGSTTYNMMGAGIAGTLGQWNHYVWSRDASNVCRIFTNGVESTTTRTDSQALTATSGAIFVGVSSNLASQYTNGQISNVRFVIGSCIYTRKFIPPTELLTAIPNTVLLMAQTRIPNNNKLFFDDSSAMNTVTPTGNATKTSFSPFGSNWSYSFNGSTDYVSLDGSSNFEFGTGDFTLEAWIYTNTTSANKDIYDTSAAADGTATGRLLFDINTGGYLRLYTDAGTTQLLQSPIGTILPYRWHHVAISRTVSFGRMFVDGNLVASGAVTTNFLTKPSRPIIGINGYDSSSAPWSGYISNLKAYKGVSLYNSNFTPSTKPSIPTETRFLGYSGYFDGVGDNLTIPQTFGLATSTTPFTMEAWVYFTAFTGISIASTAWAGFGHIPFVMGMGNGQASAGATPWFGFYNSSSWSTVVQSTTSLAVNTWYHLAYVYTGAAATIYANGINIGTAAYSSWTTTTQANFYIGRRWDTGGDTYFPGYISNFRLTIGQAVYTGNFTPPTSPLSLTQSVTANVSLPSSSNVKLLVCQSPSFIDNGANNFAITVVANASVSSYNPFITPLPVLVTANNNKFEDISLARIITTATGGSVKITKNTPFENYRLTPKTYSVYFDGTTDVLNIQGNFQYFRNSGANNQGDFCVEGWFYPRKSTISHLWTLGNEFPGRLHCSITNNALSLNLYGGNNTRLAVVPSNTWTHVAITRANAIVSAYINGTLSNSTVIAGNIGMSGGAAGTSPLWIGSNSSGSSNFEGYISNFRVIRGTPYYTSNVGSITSPFEAVRDTELITCQSATIVDNSSTGYVVTANGDAKVSEFNPFGYDITPAPIKYDANLLGGSVYFDGAGDYLTVANSNSLILSNVFTIQGWFYKSNTLSSNAAIISKGTATTGWQVMIHNSGKLMVSNATANINSITSVRPHSWNHFAVVRGASQNRTLLFLNGNLEANGTFTNSFAETNDMYIGSGRVAGANVFTGYISDLKIDAAALYANSFVPSFNSVNTTKNTAFILDKRTAIIDYSLKNSVETGGNVKVKQFSPFNTDESYSYYLDGTSGYLTIPPNNFANISGAFTLELWYYPITASGNKLLFGTWNNNQDGWGLWAAPPGTSFNSQYIYFYYGNYGSNEASIGTTNGAAQLGKWSHIAVTRDDNNNFLFFLDGQRLSAAIYGSGLTWSNTTNFVNTTTNFINIGGASNYASTHGYISNLRFVANNSIYTGNFTPPTAPLPIVQSASANVLAIEPPIVFLNGESVFFDGTGDYLDVQSSSAFAFGTNDFTIELWAYPTVAPSTSWNPIITLGSGGGTGGQEIRISQNMNGAGLGYLIPNNSNNGDVYPSFGTLTLNQWHHLALVRNGSTVTLYRNGVSVGSTTGVSFNFTNTTLIRIGGPQAAYTPGDGYFGGHITNLRVVKGTAVYTGAFIPTTSPLTAITNTSLLTCQSSTIVDNSSSPLTITTTGDARVTSDNPFISSNVRLLTARSRNYTDVSLANVRILPVGNVKVVPATPALTSNTIAGNILTIGQSFYFSGTGQDFISLPAGSDAFEFATKDFTVEFWMYTSSKTTGEYEIIESQTNNAFSLYKRSSSSGLSFRGYANTDVLIATDAIMANVANSWVHIAVSRSNINTRSYVNGLVTSNTIDRVNYIIPTTVITIGARAGGSNYFTGYLTDLRVTKGVARYTTNIFTPPNKLPVYTTSYKAGTPLVIDAIIVAGGGAGGAGAPGNFGGGGGGAGGAITTNISVIANQEYPIVIGAGASAPTSATISNSGSNTTAFGYLAIGGGGGGAGPTATNGLSGGSGGGSAYASNINSANGIIGQGFPGSAASFSSATTGGSGAGGSAQAWRSNTNFGYQRGGSGIKWVDGNYYAGGAGGFVSNNWLANNFTAFASFGGGGEGARAFPSPAAATSGGTSTGGGGGGGTAGVAAAAGSGVVVIRYPVIYPKITSTTANVIMTETGDFRYYKFTSSGNVVFPFSTTTTPFNTTNPTSEIVMDYLVVAGGGGGGGAASVGVAGAGGGAGGFLTSTATLYTGNTYTITVGAGGDGGIGGSTAQGGNGTPSVFGVFATAIGGGGGSGYDSSGGVGRSGHLGGSGGGAAGDTSPVGAGTPGQGNPGGLASPGAAGGGGGAGQSGTIGGSVGTGGDGGYGRYSTISGSNVAYAGGGSAGNDTATTPGLSPVTRAGGLGGGGTGGNGTINALAGNVNTGGGGGGQSKWSSPQPTPALKTGGAGGSGVVIFGHPSNYSVSITGAANVITENNFVRYTFTQSGTITVNSANLTQLYLR